MTEQQLPMFMSKLVEFQRKFFGLPTDVAQWAIQHTADAIEVMYSALCAEYKRIQEIENPVVDPSAPLLRLEGSIVLPALTESFCVDKRFAENASDTAGVKIGHWGSFREQFGSIEVAPSGMTNMSYYALKERSYDDHIIGAFGGEDKCASTLGDVIRLIEKQPNGEKGVLITNGSVEANVFFIYDVLGELRPVGVYRHEGAWRFCSSSGSNPCCLFDYKRIFAPSSAPVPGKEPKKSLLQPVGTVILPATTESFHSLEWFNMNNSEVKIANVGSSFKKFFGDMEVSPREGVELSIRDLARDANDTEIIAAFGGRGKCITTLSDLRGLLMRQPRGEKGVLLTNANGSANIFYIFNGTAFLRAVVVAWHVRGWCVDVCVLDGGGRWGEAGRVLAPSVASS